MTSPSARSGPLIDADRGPVFLHSLWRSGSTYLFGKFREAHRYYCLYEPLHEFMRRLDDAHMSEYSGQKIASKLNHRSMAGGYFDEYRPLQRPGVRGIPGYRESMAIAGFFAPQSNRFQRYVASLVAGCRAQGRQPMLQFCRSTGRLEFFRNSFRGINIYLERNPRDQWQSYLAAENPYYMPLTVAIATLRTSYARRLSSILQRPLPRANALFGVLRRRRVRRTLRVAQHLEGEWSDADRYRIFYAEWLRAGREARLHCDRLVDINQISHCAAPRQQLETAFSIRLDDCHIREYNRHRLSASCMAEIEQQVRELGL